MPTVRWKTGFLFQIEVC